MAEIYLQFLEETHIKQRLEGREILYYKRYVDDILVISDQNRTNEQTIVNQANSIDKLLQFKMSTEENTLTNYLHLSIHRNDNNIHIKIYRKPTCTATTIQFSSNHSYEQNRASFNYYINRMITLPITEQSKQQEWKMVLEIARKNGFPTHTI